MKRELFLILVNRKSPEDYFSQILRGEKTIEYRDLTEYYEKRLENKTFDTIHFNNGYGKNRPFIVAECKGITKTVCDYEIEIGKILETGNLELLKNF